MVLVVLTDLTMFLICSYGLTRFTAKAGVETGLEGQDDAIVATASGDAPDVGLQNETDGQVDGQAVAQAQEHASFLVVCLATTIVVMLETFVHWVLRLLFGLVQTFKRVGSWRLGAITVAIASLYMLVLAIFIISTLTEVTCTAFGFNVRTPFSFQSSPKSDSSVLRRSWCRGSRRSRSALCSHSSAPTATSSTTRSATA